jgi:hypothetical protein
LISGIRSIRLTALLKVCGPTKKSREPKIYMDLFIYLSKHSWFAKSHKSLTQLTMSTM